MRFAEVTLAGPVELRSFYHDALGLPLDGETIVVGETRLRFRDEDRGAFYHFALLVPGDRFDAALAWIRERVELLGDVFESDDWGSQAVYFHDPAGNVVELIAHHGLEEDCRDGRFAAEELVGFSELGIVGEREQLLQALESSGLELWDGELDESDRLAFVGEKGRTLILAAPGRGWMPTGRPAQLHPVELGLELNGDRVELSF